MNSLSSKPRVCIIGAGVSGVVTAKVFLNKGFDVTVIEKMPALGGVWTPSRTYPGLQTNNSKSTYAFSDFPYPENVDDFPCGSDVFQYLSSYVKFNNVDQHIRFNTNVKSVARIKDNSNYRFKVETHPSDIPTSISTETFQYVVVCNGVYSVQNIPDIPGQNNFGGEILHSSEFHDTKILKNKSVVVIGGGKSAVDCAVAAAKYAKSSTIVMREPHWMMPRYLLGKKTADLTFISRFSEMFTKYHRKSKLEIFVHGPCSGLVKLWWALIKRLLVRICKIPKHLIPQQRLPHGLETAGASSEFYDFVNEKKITAICTKVDGFDESSVHLNNGESVDCDLVIFATGWQQIIDLLDQELKDEILVGGKFRLYRHILSPKDQCIGFIGYQSSSACLLSSEVAAHWLVNCFLGKIDLPNNEAMQHQIDLVLKWLTETFPAADKGHYIGTHLTHYIDELMEDMGQETKRVANSFSNFFGPVLPNWYKDI